MKKTLLTSLGLVAMLAATNVNAQILSETFDTAIPATWTIIDVDGHTSTSSQSAYASWAWGSGEALSSSWYDNAGTGPTDDWLITPGIVIPASGTFQLEYDAYSHEASYLEEYEILYSTTGNTVTDFTATALLTVVNEPFGDATTPNAHTIVLPAAVLGQTIYIAFHHTSDDESMLHIDNVVVKELLADDAAMTSVSTPAYLAAGNTNIAGVITNNGANTITAMDVTWDDGSGAQVDNLTGLNIAAGATYNFTHTTPLAVVAGSSYTLTVSVTLVGDLDATNNSLNTNTAGLTQIPTKIVVGEEKTGTWCGWCPRGGAGLAGMEATANFIGIAVHNNDPMAIANYDAGTATYHPDFNGYPHGAVDRVIGGDPSTFNTMHPARVTAIVPCDVKNVVAQFNSSTNMISVSADAEFYGNITGEYRMSCVIVEDDILGDGTALWNQVNYYSSTSQNQVLVDPVTGFDWQAAANPVNPTAFGGYDHAARSLSNNDIMGNAGSITTNPTIGVYSYNFTDVSSSVINDYNKSHAVVMVINAATSEILNATIVPITSATGINENNVVNSVSIFPNPTNQTATISFNVEKTALVKVEIFNAMGVLVQNESKTVSAGRQNLTFDGSNLSNGIYFVNITTGEQTISKKISLLK